jgi:hypothetical protein
MIKNLIILLKKIANKFKRKKKADPDDIYPLW